MLPFTATQYRSHQAGQLRLLHAGQTVVLSGWVQSIRRFKGIVFVELREASGLVQLLFKPEAVAELTEESCIRIEGTVQARSRPHPNPAAYPTGEVEVLVTSFSPLNVSQGLPFSRLENPSEEQLLRHRTLALRWPAQEEPLKLRAAIVKAMRGVVEEAGFLEVETPVLVRNTPGGAAPFLVPAGEGRGYALAQSPQVWKQLLVCGGVERYYQLAHCFRNEGSRPERQPEFSQMEIEMAFTTAHQVQAVMEAMVQAAAATVHVPLPAHFPVLTYLEAMRQFGSDKPHLGNPLRLESALATSTTRREPSEVRLTLPKPPSAEEALAWLERAQAVMGRSGHVTHANGVFTAQGPHELAQQALGSLIPTVGQAWGLIEPGVFPVWVTQFPLLERNEWGQWVSAHHPFTQPVLEEGRALQHHSPETLMAEAFDLAINGQEVGGGSMRIHHASLQREVFELLRMSRQESEAHFRPLLEALEMGAPPHGGMALGVERLVATLLGLPHIRHVMAFPKTAGGQCLLTGALS